MAGIHDGIIKLLQGSSSTKNIMPVATGCNRHDERLRYTFEGYPGRKYKKLQELI